MSSARFTGAATLEPLHSFPPGDVRVSLVTFPAGVTTHWHHHTGGQFLVVLTGVARVQFEGGEVMTLNAGETCAVPPHVEHWHGATEDAPMIHIAVTGQDTIWGPAPEL